MILQGKVAAIAKQIENKLGYGINTVELQLLPGDNADSVMEVLLKYPELTINVVHPTLGDKKGSPYVVANHLSNDGVLYNFITACVVADMISKTQKHKVGVILHNAVSARDYELTPVLFDHVVTTLKRVKEYYKGIYFLIENVTPFSAYETTSNGIMADDVVKFVKMLQAEGIEDVGITLDVCHVRMTYRFFNLMYSSTELGLLSESNLNKFTLEYWLKTYGDLIKNIHIASCIGDGILPEHHGTALDKRDKTMLQTLYYGCAKYAPHAMWTIEVKESDYSDSINQIQSLKCIENILGFKLGENNY